jgi:hypothetical protein
MRPGAAVEAFCGHDDADGDTGPMGIMAATVRVASDSHHPAIGRVGARRVGPIG